MRRATSSCPGTRWSRCSTRSALTSRGPRTGARSITPSPTCATGVARTKGCTVALDLNAVASMAAKARGAETKSVGELPDNADDYVAALVDDEVLNIGQATALRLLIGKARVEAVA